VTKAERLDLIEQLNAVQAIDAALDRLVAEQSKAAAKSKTKKAKAGK
jgi:hypothetical protein